MGIARVEKTKIYWRSDVKPGDAVNTVLYGMWLVISVTTVGNIIRITYVTPERELPEAKRREVDGRLFVTTEGPNNEFFSDVNQLVRFE